MQHIRIESDLLILHDPFTLRLYANKLILHERDSPTLVTLPTPAPCLEFEFLQLSEHDLTISTNSQHEFMNKTSTLTLHGFPDNYGKSIKLMAFNGCWRIPEIASFTLGN
jgi:hypothetical protein